MAALPEVTVELLPLLLLAGAGVAVSCPMTGEANNEMAVKAMPRRYFNNFHYFFVRAEGNRRRGDF
jgi:hypothetical protein